MEGKAFFPILTTKKSLHIRGRRRQNALKCTYTHHGDSPSLHFLFFTNQVFCYLNQWSAYRCKSGRAHANVKQKFSVQNVHLPFLQKMVNIIQWERSSFVFVPLFSPELSSLKDNEMKICIKLEDTQCVFQVACFDIPI